MTDSNRNVDLDNNNDLQPPPGEIELRKKLSKMIDDLNFDIQSGLEKSGISSNEEELTDDERKYLISVERGDAPSIKSMLDNKSKLQLNVNCVDSLGRTALHIAIENEHNEMLELLLSYNLEISDSLLHAISEENIEAVEIILVAMDKRPKKKDLLELLGNSSNAFTSDITPLILAAHRDNYPIIKILLDRGNTIPKPHDLRCACHECVTSQKEDSLRHSRSRINAYKALASPSLICLSSKDPILTAFELSWELNRLGILENEFKTDYELLADQCEQFATDLLAQTRGSSELATILNHDHGQANTMSINPLKIESNQMEETMTLSRLKLAIRYKQKSFVVHPHCQQLLSSLWYEGLPGIRRLSFINQSAVIGLICASFPALSLFYIFLPKSKMGSIVKKPFIKFICHQSSYVMFLILLTISAMKFEFVLFGNYVERLSDRGPPPAIAEWGVMVYLAGFIWQEVKQLYSNGLRAYLADMWNLLDFSTNALYSASLALRITAYFNVKDSSDRFIERQYWESYEPVLISECLFASANICSVMKLVFMFTISPRLGPLQISLGRMLRDILNFFFLYVLVLVAYAFGIHQLYWFYSYKRKETCKDIKFSYSITGQDLERYQYCVTWGRYFTNIFEIIQSLYWTAYGLVDLTITNLEYDHQFTEFIGKLMLGSYCYISIIMLLNMFIAMMNSSYQIIVEKSDKEWKFARSKLWISFFEEGATIPVPFNIIPSPKSFCYFFLAIKHCLCGCQESHNRSKWKSIRKLVKKVNEKEARHQVVIKDLIKRYIIHRQKAGENQGVTEDDLNEIKGDISSFRFELIEIFKMNNMKTPVYTTSKMTKLRHKGSKKGFHRILRKPDDNSNISKFASIENSKDSNNEPTVKIKFPISFDNEGFNNNEPDLKMITPITHIVISEECDNTMNETNVKDNNFPAQPLNVSEFLHDSGTHRRNSSFLFSGGLRNIKHSTSADNIRQSSSKLPIDKKPLSERRVDMV